MSAKAAIRAEADRLRAYFEARGAQVFETDILQPAGAFLNLYGEDIRARAFIAHDPLRGEMMLRPDFTVPLVERHLGLREQAARYTYAGEVFRRQEEYDDRPSEYFQVGYEIFNGDHAEDDEAEVFSAFDEVLGGENVTRTIGDFGLIQTAIDCLDTPERRKKALLRHLWRPRRFDALLERFSRPAPPPPMSPDPDVPHVGLRSREEIAARIALLAEEADTPPLKAEEVARIRALSAIRAPAPEAVTEIKRIGAGDATITAAADRVSAVLDALVLRRIDPDGITFEANFGLTSLEYYSGFVFGFAAPGHIPVATGGRYDLLTASMSDGKAIPAVGGVIRPEILLAMKESAA
ncbi:MAG: ATP phosphoribosyltransferase regulatory subunit [Rhodobacteraceae bacterium]|nr:MAG: ATP phosphoribosyltransferase regulatory subunit [Paracoccaceae bacterium]